MAKKFQPFQKTLQIFSDDRGIFAPFLQEESVEKGLRIKRVYHVYNPTKGIIRGFHLHRKEWKYFTIVQGSAKFIVINPDSPEEKFEFISSSRLQKIITIPPLYANGWISLEDNTILLAASTSTVKESLRDDTRFDPYMWGDVWSVKGR
jgi:dTDP-4-dehydrorhamnose 3,5-epimerase-like enzyme